jgi:hypothetical protein
MTRQKSTSQENVALIGVILFVPQTRVAAVVISLGCSIILNTI